MNSRNVFVLGHRGMLGHTVARWLADNGFRVRTTDTRYVGGQDDALIKEVRAEGSGAVVNCIGTVPKRAPDERELLLTNALLPQHLAATLGSERLLIHASSDGVFDGVRGGYAVLEPPNASDAYGISKRLGEMALHAGRVVVLRCSIVGLDPGGRGLLSWFLSQRAPVTGYRNHRWNGITVLQWAKIAARALAGDPLVAPGIHQPACAAAVSKYELLRLAAPIFGQPIAIVPSESPHPVDRTLVPTISTAAIDAQLEELRDWRGTFRG